MILMIFFLLYNIKTKNSKNNIFFRSFFPVNRQEQRKNKFSSNILLYSNSTRLMLIVVLPLCVPWRSRF
jgi:hypothetical protein